MSHANATVNATATNAKESPRSTKLGSPCSRVWDDAWIAVIDDVETKLGRRICGARTLTGVPCVLTPNHENGRCRFHGGFYLTGAPSSNRPQVKGRVARKAKIARAKAKSQCK